MTLENNILKERKKVDKLGRSNMSNSQIKYQLTKRKERYPNFKYPILSKKRLYFVENFCEHGNLEISPHDFDIVYFKFDNNLNFYCPKCKQIYLNSIDFSINDIEINRQKLIEIYNYSAKLKENYLNVNEPYLYQCILNNTNKNVSWNERVFLFKNNLYDKPICIFKNCNKETFFSISNQRYTNFCKDHVGGFTSKGELEVRDFISSFNINIKKYRINGNELDMYIPDLKLALEFNGLYWHNELYKEKKYHFNKWKICKDNNIQLITIWQDDWNNKQDIIKSLIVNKLGRNNNKIYARNCIIKEVSNIITNNFLKNNHLQGACNSSIRLGLFHNDELVSLMTFGKRNIGNTTQFELIRFCSKIYTNVIGAASKLFNYFINNYKFEKIISYANCDISNGDLYEKLNFKNLGHTGINYWWSNNWEKIHRVKFMKHKISNFEGRTEKEIMINRGYNRIFGTGNIKYEYIK